MGEYASKGVAGAGLGTGIAGLALGVLNSGFLNGWNGWNFYLTILKIRRRNKNVKENS